MDGWQVIRISSFSREECIHSDKGTLARIKIRQYTKRYNFRWREQLVS